MKRIIEKQKIKLFIILLLTCLLAANVSLLNGCTSTSQAQEVRKTFTVPQIKTGTITLTSLDQEEKVDTVSYSIKRITENRGKQTVYEEINTTEGTFSKPLTLGKYEISANGIYTYSTVVDLKEDGEIMEVSAQNNCLYMLLSKSEKVCVIGDSITSGSRTNGKGWHEGLLSKFENIKETQVVAKPGQTTASLFEDEARMALFEQADADTYIIALGVNDCIKRDSDTKTTYSTEEYITNIEKMEKYIREKENGEKAEIVFVSPFTYTNRNKTSIDKYLKRDNIHQVYINALEKWCAEKQYLCVSSMNYVNHVLETVEDISEYMADDLHPAYPKGTELYAEAVYQGCTTEMSGTLEVSQDFYKRTIKQAGQTPNYAYELKDKKNDIHGATYFSIRNYDTGKYVEIAGGEDANKTGVYYYDGEESDEVLFYSVGEDTARMIIEDMPKGCYQIIYGGNTKGYDCLKDVIVIYVTAGRAPTYATIVMNAEKTES